MSLTFPTAALNLPSGLTVIPNGFIRPSFGTTYAFDEAATASTTFQAEYNTEAYILAVGSPGLGLTYFVTDKATPTLAVYDGTDWQYYEGV